MDVADEDAWERLAPHLGDVHGLVCAAAVLDPVGPIGSYAVADFRRTLNINVVGTLLAIGTCLPALRASRGAVVTFGGGGATSPLPRFDAYAASKAAVVRLTENLALELAGEGVRVNCVSPGFVATSIHRSTLAAGPELAGADYFERTRAELERGGVPAREAAELICLLLEGDPDAPFTGKLISAQWDGWREAGFRRRLASEPGSRDAEADRRRALQRDGRACERMSGPFASYVPAEHLVNWSEDLERLHEESSRTHFIDVWTRRAMLVRVGPLPAAPTVIDVGCSTGYLLEDLRRAIPAASLIGVDLVAGGLRKAHANVPEAVLLQADACALPLEDASVDAAVSANLLEHVPNDERALAEVFRILRPGARAVIVVPVGPGNYDYYDRFLGHERRYARAELAGKATAAGFEILEDIHLGAPLYPAFWAVKQRNRRRYEHLQGAALEDKVREDITSTSDSVLGPLACRLEEWMLARNIRLPFGIRGLTVLERSRKRA